MLMRLTDASGDILPVLSSSAMVSGPEAVVALIRDRLNLLTGEWWENPEWGCGIVEMLRSSRITEQDVPAIASYLTSYIAATTGVVTVEDVTTVVNEREFSFSCRVITKEGSGEVSYAMNL